MGNRRRGHDHLVISDHDPVSVLPFTLGDLENSCLHLHSCLRPIFTDCIGRCKETIPLDVVPKMINYLINWIFERYFRQPGGEVNLLQKWEKLPIEMFASVNWSDLRNSLTTCWCRLRWWSRCSCAASETKLRLPRETRNSVWNKTIITWVQIKSKKDKNIAVHSINNFWRTCL